MYGEIQDFRSGVDRRKTRASGAPGSLWVGSNCHITEGGEIEKRYKLVPKYQLYPGHTWGMKGVGATRYVFGYEDSATFPGNAIPTGVTYQRLVHPSVASMPIAAILDAIAFLGMVYVIVQFANGDIHHYWNGSRVTDWDGGTGKPAAKGTFGIAVGSKIYIAAGNTVYFCDLDDPTNWTIGTGSQGAGFFNVTSSGKGSQNLVAMAPFQVNQATGIVFFASNFAQTWAVASNPSSNVYQSTIDNTGAVASHGTVGVGNVDTFFLSSSGVRSLKQQTVNGIPWAVDMGDPVRSMLKADLASLDPSVIFAAFAAVNPFDGRIWFWLGPRIYVYSSFPSSKVQAWTWYDVTGMAPGQLDIVGNRLNMRSGDTIYVYGGDSGADYDQDSNDIYYADIELPFMVANNISANKLATAYDVGAQGEWQVFMKSDPNNPDVEDALGDIEDFTYANPTYSMGIESTHFAARFRSVNPGPASICNFAFNFERTQ